MPKKFNKKRPESPSPFRNPSPGGPPKLRQDLSNIIDDFARTTISDPILPSSIQENDVSEKSFCSVIVTGKVTTFREHQVASRCGGEGTFARHYCGSYSVDVSPRRSLAALADLDPKADAKSGAPAETPTGVPTGLTYRRYSRSEQFFREQAEPRGKKDVTDTDNADTLSTDDTSYLRRSQEWIIPPCPHVLNRNKGTVNNEESGTTVCLPDGIPQLYKAKVKNAPGAPPERFSFNAVDERERPNHRWNLLEPPFSPLCQNIYTQTSCRRPIITPRPPPQDRGRPAETQTCHLICCECSKPGVSKSQEFCKCLDESKCVYNHLWKGEGEKSGSKSRFCFLKSKKTYSRLSGSSKKSKSKSCFSRMKRSFSKKGKSKCSGACSKMAETPDQPKKEVTIISRCGLPPQYVVEEKKAPICEPHQHILCQEGAYVVTNRDPARYEIYTFDHQNSDYLKTTDAPLPLYTEMTVDKTEEYTSRFWAEVFGGIHIVLAFIVSFILQLFKFLFVGLVRPLMIGLTAIFSDYFLKPFCTTLFNSIIQPIFIFLHNVARSFRDLCLPIARALGHFTREIAHVLRAIRLFEVNTNTTNGPFFAPKNT